MKGSLEFFWFDWLLNLWLECEIVLFLIGILIVRGLKFCFFVFELFILICYVYFFFEIEKNGCREKNGNKFSVD